MEQNNTTTENKQNEKDLQTFSFSDYVNADSVICVAEDMSGQFLEGDIVFIRKQKKFNPGDLVAIDVEYGGLVCRRYSDGDIVVYTREDGGVPILIDLDEQKDVKILGLVVGVYFKGVSYATMRAKKKYSHEEMNALIKSAKENIVDNFTQR